MIKIKWMNNSYGYFIIKTPFSFIIIMGHLKIKIRRWNYMIKFYLYLLINRGGNLLWKRRTLAK